MGQTPPARYYHGFAAAAGRAFVFGGIGEYGEEDAIFATFGMKAAYILSSFVQLCHERCIHL